MILLDKEHIEYIEKVLNVAKLLDISEVVFSKNKVGGMTEAKTTAMFQTEEIPDFGFETMAINQVNSLLSFLASVKIDENFTIEFVNEEGEDFVRKLIIKSDSTVINYMCINPVHVKIPSAISDDFMCEVSINKNLVAGMQKMMEGLKSVEFITLKGNSEGVCFEIRNVRKDIAIKKITSVAPEEDFSNRYSLKTLSVLLKEEPEANILIGRKSLLKFNLHGIDVFLRRTVEGER